MEQEVGEYLRSKNLDPQSKGDGQWLLRCVFCSDSKNPKHRHLYVSKEHGAFKCHRCDEEGGFNKLREQLGDKKITRSDVQFSKSEVYRGAVRIASDKLFDHLEIVEYLNKRGITSQSIVDFQLGYMDGSWVQEMRETFDLHSLREANLIQEFGNDFWCYQAILIPYVENDTIVQLRGKQLGGGTIGLPHVPTRLFNRDAVRGAPISFICEGEMDAILLSQKGYPTAGVPGAGAFKDLWIDAFADARKIFIIPDHDKVNENTGKRAGIEGARRTERLIGGRAKILPLPVEDDEPTDVTDYFIRDGYSDNDFGRLVYAATDRRLFTFDAAYKEYQENLSANGLSTGFKDLDRYIFPGMLPGQVVIVLAKTGVGKTTLATQFVWNFVDADVPTMMLSLEQMKGEVASRLYKIARFADTSMGTERIAPRLDKHFRLNDENRIPPEDVAFLIEEFEEQVGCRPKVIIVDYLGYWSRSFRGGSAYEQTTAAIMELKNIAKREKMVIIAPHQVSRSGHRGEKLTLDMARDSGAIEETGDFVMGLYAPSHRDGADSGQMTFKDRAELRLDLLKSRHGNSGKDIRMFFAPMSLAIRPATMIEQPRIQKEWAAFDRSLTYPEFEKERRA